MKALKKKSSSYQNKITSKQFQYLLQNGIKVYAVSDPNTKKWFIESDTYGKIKTFTKLVMQDEIQEAIDKTLVFYYKHAPESKTLRYLF